jgi:hypothetical protein
VAEPSRFRVSLTRSDTDRAKGAASPKPLREIATDDQTGQSYVLDPEHWFGTVVAGISAIYLISALALLLWLLVDTWSGRNTLLVRWGYDNAKLATGSFRLMAYVAIAGALGGSVDGIRSLISWHAERRAFGARFFWKYLSLPPVGAAVGLIAYLTLRSGVGLVNGDFTLNQRGTPPALAAFAVAAVAGLSSLQVFRWLDAEANKLFNVGKATQTVVPDLLGMSADGAKAALKARKLSLGTVSGDPGGADTVVRQSPAANAKVPEQAPVDIHFGPTAEAEVE